MVDEKRKFTSEVAGKHKVIFKLIENHPKISKYRSRSAILNIRENGKMLFGTLLYSSSIILKISFFAVLPLALPCSTLSLAKKQQQLNCNHNIKAHLTI